MRKLKLTEKQQDALYWIQFGCAYHELFHNRYVAVDERGMIAAEDIWTRTIRELENKGLVVANITEEEEKVQIALGVINDDLMSHTRVVRITAKGKRFLN